MQVAKYWRNKKLRYRLVRDVQVVQRGSEPSIIGRKETAGTKSAAKRELAGVAS